MAIYLNRYKSVLRCNKCIGLSKTKMCGVRTKLHKRWCINLTLGRLRFPNDNEYENDEEISLSFSLRFCTQRDERHILFVVYYNRDNEYETRKNTRNDDIGTQKFRSRTRCRSEILTLLLYDIIDTWFTLWKEIRFNTNKIRIITYPCNYWMPLWFPIFDGIMVIYHGFTKLALAWVLYEWFMSSDTFN